MNNTDKFFKGQYKNEIFVCFFRNHWISILRELVYFTIFLVVMTITISNIFEIIGFLRGNRELELLFLTVLLGATYFFHRFFIQLINFFLNTGIITNKRIIDHQKTLFFRDNMDAVRIEQIQNVERLGDGLLQNLFNYGDIRIYLNASSSVKTFANMPNAKFHFRCINRQIEQRRRREHKGIKSEVPILEQKTEKR